MSADHLPQMLALASRLAEAVDAGGEIIGIAIVTVSPEGELINHMMTGDPAARVKTSVFAGCEHQLDALSTLDDRLYIDVTPPEEVP